MIKTLLTLVIYSLTLTGMVFASALAAEANREKCTCNFDDRSDRYNGSEVTNATSCLQDRYESENWCDIEVVTLEAMVEETNLLISRLLTPLDQLTPLDRPNEASKNLVSEKLVGYLFFRFQSFVSTLRLPDVAKIHIDKISQSLSISRRMILDCVSNYERGTAFTDFDRDTRLGCYVSKESKWLRLNIPIDGHVYVFLVAPQQPE